MSLYQQEELFVTGIAGDATETEIVELFTSAGTTVKEFVSVSKRKDPNVTQAALVRMAGHECALKAKHALDKSEFKGKRLIIRWSHTARVLWISHLHESVTNEVWVKHEYDAQSGADEISAFKVCGW